MPQRVRLYTLRTHADDVAVCTPTLVVGYDLAREGASAFHRSSAGHRVTPRQAGLRSGTITLLFTGATAEADAAACEASIASGIVHRFSTNDYTPPVIASLQSFRFALAGRLRRWLDPETQAQWLVEIDVQEVD